MPSDPDTYTGGTEFPAYFQKTGVGIPDNLNLELGGTVCFRIHP